MNEQLMVGLRGFENNYPYGLEEQFARIVEKIAQLWDTPEIDSYFTELLIDSRGNRARVMLFIKAGMAVDARDENEWTPLMVAAFHGNEVVARVLIGHGANMHARDRGG